LLLDALPDWWTDLIRDVRDGTCKDSQSWPAAVRQVCVTKPLGERAVDLEHADPKVPDAIWPDLAVISCWGDAHAEAAANNLSRNFPNAFVQPKGLLATEAFVTLPFGNAHPLAVGSHFFEFVDETGKIFRAHELRSAQIYEVLVTTAGGLWRYRLGDQVKVTGFVASTPSLRFVGRTGNVSDRFGEKLSEGFVSAVLRTITSQWTAPPRFILLAPDQSETKLGYTCYLEGEPCSGMAEELDIRLRENPHYAYSRHLGQLQPPRIFRIRRGGYESFIARGMARGLRLGDIKASALSNQDDWTRHFAGDYVRAGLGAETI
jgi:hypothetical protein